MSEATTNDNSGNHFNPFLPDKKLEPKLRRIIRIVLCGFIVFPIRVIFLCLLCLLWGSLVLILYFNNDTKPNKEFRPVSQPILVLFDFIRISLRCCLFVFGFHNVKIKGEFIRDSTKAPIVVSNHVSFIDAFVVGSLFMPCCISEADNVNLPFIGVYLKNTQAILVDRRDPQSRKACAEAISSRARYGLANKNTLQLLIFPEGTCTSGQSLITFRTGAFAPGVPVLPLCLNYNGNQYVDYSWTVSSRDIVPGLLRIMTEWNNNLTITILPPYIPSEEEKKDAALFARNVRAKMAQALSVPVTEASFDDARFLLEAKKLRMPLSKLKNVSFTELNKLYDISFDGAKELMRKFVKCDKNKTGKLGMDEFLKTLQLPKTPETEELFDSFTDESGAVDFRSYIVGILATSKEVAQQNKEFIKHCFTLFDTDGNGTVSRMEFDALMKAQFPEISEYQINSLFDEMDVKQQGKVTFEEFEKYALTNPLYVALAKKKLAQSTEGSSVKSSSKRRMVKIL